MYVRVFLCFFLFLLCGTDTDGAGPAYTKTVSGISFVNKIRVIPGSNNSFYVISLDSMRIALFDSCGNITSSKQLNIPGSHSSLNDVVRYSDGSLYFISRVLDGSEYGALMSKTDPSGSLLWSKTINITDYNIFPYTLTTDNQGNLVFYANCEHKSTAPVHNLILKTDTSGNVIWSKFYNHGGVWGRLLQTSDGGMLARTGSLFIKTDASGNVNWTSDITAATYYYNAATEVHDGYIFTGYNNTNQRISFFKIDKQGNLLWNGRKTSDFTGQPPFLRNEPNGNIAGVFKRNIAGSTFNAVVEFDADLNIVHEVYIDNPSGLNLSGTDMCFLSDNSVIVCGSSSTGEMFFSKLNPDYSGSCLIQLSPVNIIMEQASAALTSTSVQNVITSVVTNNYTNTQLLLSVNTVCEETKEFNLINDTSLCGPSEILLKNTFPYLFAKYLWNGQAGGSEYTTDSSGFYVCEASDYCSSVVFRDSLLIEILSSPDASLGDDRVLCDDSAIVLAPPVCNLCSYIWQDGSTEESYTVMSPGNYWLKLSTPEGCESSDTVRITKGKCFCNIWFPNAFTPGSDGLNDVYLPESYCDFSSFILRIYNRWGELVFESDNPGSGWDGLLKGNPASQDVYAYFCKYKPLNAGQVSAEEIKTGFLTLMR